MKSPATKAGLHAAVFIASIALLLFSEQNPRVLVYGHVLSLLLRMITVSIGASVSSDRLIVSVIRRHCRLPTRFDTSKPYRDAKTREPAGLLAYIVGILTLLFMVGILILLAQGPAFLEPAVLLTELAFGVLLASVFWLDDFLGRQYILDPAAKVYQNLGYNTSAMNFMVAAIFLTVFGYVVIVFALTMIAGTDLLVIPIDWALLILLSLLKLGYQLKMDFGDP